MTLCGTIKDGAGNPYYARVDKNNSLVVSQTKTEVIQETGTENVYRYLTGKLGTAGLESGATSMDVNGSSTPQEFYVAASQDYDIYIRGIAIVIADGNIAHNDFGDLSALSVGFDLYVEESGIKSYLIEKAYTNGVLLLNSGFARPYGDSNTVNELTNWDGSSDACTVFIPIQEYIPGGVRIGRGTDDRMVAVVNDDLRGLTDFFVKIFGYRHYEI